MTYRDIYMQALALIGEPADNNSTADYAGRAPALLTAVNAAVYLEVVRHALKSAEMAPKICQNLDEEYPYSEYFSSPTAMMLASYLILDRDSKVGELLTEAAVGLIKNIKKPLTKVESCVEVYPD